MGGTAEALLPRTQATQVRVHVVEAIAYTYARLAVKNVDCATCACYEGPLLPPGFPLQLWVLFSPSSCELDC